MGQYFMIVNPAKRQYLDIGCFAGEYQKASGVLQGNHAIAVAVLVCQLAAVRHTFGSLAGAWYGDPVIAAGDDEGQPDLYGVKTATEQRPYRNLYWMAREEFEDISYQALAMLCQGRPGFAAEIAAAASESAAILVDVGNTIVLVGCEPLEREVIARLGAQWIKRYKQACLDEAV